MQRCSATTCHIDLARQAAGLHWCCWEAAHHDGCVAAYQWRQHWRTERATVHHRPEEVPMASGLGGAWDWLLLSSSSQIPIYFNPDSSHITSKSSLLFVLENTWLCHRICIFRETANPRVRYVCRNLCNIVHNMERVVEVSIGCHVAQFSVVVVHIATTDS